MKVYKTIIIPLPTDEYMILVPDFPGCFMISYSVRDAIEYATEWVKDEIKRTGVLPDSTNCTCNVKEAFSSYIVVI